MFHFDDFLELLEPLPQEVKNQLAKLRELDEHVQHSLEDFTKNIENFFSIADHLNADVSNQKFNAIMKNGEKAVEYSETKIQISNCLKTLLEKYLNKLDHDLLNLQVDLEDKCVGITEKIEERLLNSEKSYDTIQEGNNFQLNKYIFGGQNEQSSSSDEIQVISDSNSECSRTKIVFPGLNKTNKNCLGKEIKLERKSSTSRSLDTSINNKSPDKSSRKIKLNRANNNKQKEPPEAPSTSKKESTLIEPRYCICNEFAYDKMVACDCKTCPYKWFHFDCVGISGRPQGKWYCIWCAKRLKKKQPKLSLPKP